MNDITLPKLKDWAPTGFDSRANYMGTLDYDEYHVVYCKTRDHGAVLTQSNWDLLCEKLHAESDNGCEVLRFGHWGCGHYDLLIVSPDSPVLQLAQEIADSLESYPILCERHYSDMMCEAQTEAFRSIESDFMVELERKFQFETEDSFEDGCDLADVSTEDLHNYFDMCARESNTDWNDSDNGLEINLDRIVACATLQGMIKHLPGMKLHSGIWATLDHAVLHEIASAHVVVKDLYDNILEVPEFIAVHHDKRQVKIFPNS